MVRDKILEIIELNKKIRLGHEDNSISYKNYSETVKPTIEEFKKANHETPNKYLKQFLEPIYSSLQSGYQLTNFQYYGNNKLHEHVWACIYFKYPEIKSLYASSSPQLYVLVHSKGIKFGVDYGAQVENGDLLVSQVRESNELQDLIIEVTKSIDAFKLEQGAHYLAQKSDKVSLNTREAVRLTWDNSVHIINQFESDNIPINIEEEISITLTTLKPLFVKLCEIKNTIKIEQEITQEGQDKNFNSNVFFEHLESSGLQFSKLLCNRFIASMITKPLVIFTGLSGSGKTKLAQAFVQWVSQNDDQYRIVPVGADWTNREPLLGYPNALNPDE